MLTEKKVYTLKETAKILGIGNNLIYKLAKNKQIPVLHLGRRMVVPAAALDEMLSNVK